MPPEATAGAALSIFERQILKLIAEGKTSQEISKLLYLDMRTVYHHYVEIMTKLNINNPGDLVRYAINAGYRFKEI